MSTDWKALCAELVHGWTEGHDIAGPMANARAFLSQPEPEGLTDEEIEKRFQRWWFDEGSGMRPSNGEDQEEHTRRVSQIAWSNGAYVARYDCPTTPTETNGH